MHARFLAQDASRPGDSLVLSRDEAEHLVRVLRLGAGAEVRVFNGRGREFLAVVDAAGRRGVTVRLVEELTPAREPALRVTLAQAVLRGDHTDGIVRDAVMLGVAAIQPIVSTRSLATMASVARGHRRERWQRIAVSSAKQCGRAVVPEVAPAATLDAFLARDRSDVRLLLTEPSARWGSKAGLAALGTRPAPGSLALLVGPEGGWPEEEAELALSHGFEALTLGALTLRADAAALVALSAILAVWHLM